MMAPATQGWRAVFLLGECGGVSRQVAFWATSVGVGPAWLGIVVDDDGGLTSAHELPGFVGYADPEDDPEKMIVAARKRLAEKESTP